MAICMAKNSHFVLSGSIRLNKTAFSGIATLFNIKLAGKITSLPKIVIKPILARFGHNMAKMAILS